MPWQICRSRAFGSPSLRTTHRPSTRLRAGKQAAMTEAPGLQGSSVGGRETHRDERRLIIGYRDMSGIRRLVPGA